VPNQPLPPTDTQQQDELTDTVVLRSPEKNNGETSRVFRRDKNDNVREIVVNYSDRRHGLISKDATGHVTSLQMTLLSGATLEGKIAADSKTISAGRQFAPDGKLRLVFAPGRFEGYQPDGTTLSFVGVMSSSGKNWTLYQSDGKTIAAEEQDDGTADAVRSLLKLYGATGNLQYSETPTPSATTSSWGARSYTGLVYGAQGVPTHRVLVQENIWDGGGGFVQQIEEFEPDGVTVKTTNQINRGAPVQYKLGVYASQDELIKAKRAVWSSLTDDRSASFMIVTQLSGLLID